MNLLYLMVENNLFFIEFKMKRGKSIFNRFFSSFVVHVFFFVRFATFFNEK